MFLPFCSGGFGASVAAQPSFVADSYGVCVESLGMCSSPFHRSGSDDLPIFWYSLNETTAEYQYLYNNSKTLYDPCPAGWKTSYQTVYKGWSTGQGYWFNTNGAFVQNGSAHERGGRLYNVSGGGGVPSPRTEDNTAWFPVTAYRSFVNGNLIFNI